MNQVFRRRHNHKGFTLIELLVVVLILGILLAVAIPLYLSSVKNSATETSKANCKTIAQAAQAYKVKNGAYPADLATMTGSGKDLEQVPAGPRGVTYSFAPGTGDIGVVTATEGGQDAFNTTATNEAATYTISTGAYSGF
ncbi:MAG: prepilin-type N-terminal cleavage/methylation domain-containing protein [Armatimonas sp.]